jgi:glucoamylase
VNGKAAGSASPLTWSAGAFVRLFADIAANKLVDQPHATADRYITHKQGQTSLTVTAPADLSSVPGSPVTVTGTSAPGNRIDVLATNTDHDSSTTSASTTALSNGSFSIDVPVSGGTTVLNVVATASDDATAHVTRTVVFDFVPGTLLFQTTDPDNDDNGPGNYAYPTSSNFHAGAFDLEAFQVYDDGTNIIFRVQTRDLSPTFGSPLGAQLVDVYVHDPAAATGSTSTAAAFPERNYEIATGSAWNRLVEVQGFGQRYVDKDGNPLGTVKISANQVSRFITISVPKSSLGTPTSGWTFTVVLTGQDGFSSDQARGFAPTPQDFLFGVCATASADPHCTAPPGTVPKAVDVLTPPGVPQSDELDYTVHDPVIIQGVTVP